MITTQQFKDRFEIRAEHINMFVRNFKNEQIDWDVYLPTKGMNLQRDFVWTLDQKRELIYSIILRRNIPDIALINIVTKEHPIDGVYQVIDGKQRLSSMIDFHNNLFTVIVDGKEYLFSELPGDIKMEVNSYSFSAQLINESSYDKITDDLKIKWFKLINFAGTPQDKEHMEKL